MDMKNLPLAKCVVTQSMICVEAANSQLAAWQTFASGVAANATWINPDSTKVAPRRVMSVNPRSPEALRPLAVVQEAAPPAGVRGSAPALTSLGAAPRP